MCFDYDALPPELPAGVQYIAQTGGEHVTLTSADGTPFSAYISRAAVPSGAAIVILPDVRGLFRFYEELAERYASAGIDAIAIDYFGRTAGLGPREESFEFWPHVTRTTAATVTADITAAVGAIRSAAAPRAIFTVGFCFGGQTSLRQGYSQPGLAGVIAYYGPPNSDRFGPETPLRHAKDFTAPVLAFYGEADQGIPMADVHAFDDALGAAGIEHQIHSYPDAPHSFFDRKQEEFQRESADSWTKALAFIAAHTPRA